LITSEPWLAPAIVFQRERHGALLRAHAVVCPTKCLTPPTLSEMSEPRCVGNWLSTAVRLVGGCPGLLSCRSLHEKQLRLQGTTGSCKQGTNRDQAIRRSRVVTPGAMDTGVSGFISYDFCKLAGLVPRPSLIFLLQGASMRRFVSSSIDFGSRLR